jgi:hypothetical protein
MQLSWADVVENTRTYRDSLRFPDQADTRSRDGILFPAIYPRFSLAEARKIFTIGSCFARNIEEKLKGYDVPTLNFKPPREEHSRAAPTPSSTNIIRARCPSAS